MNILVLIIPTVLALILSRLLIPFIILVSYKKRLFDPVDARKQHTRIVPRLGGVAFAPIQCCLYVVTLVVLVKVFKADLNVESWALLPSFMMLICGLVMLFIGGIGDDLVGLDYKWKFILQVVVASLLPLSGLWINHLYGLFGLTHISAWIGMPLTVFFVVLIINAINMIDGLDGLCSGIVSVGCMALGILFIYYGAWLHALFAMITVGVLLPFFFINVYGVTRRRRQIFMGDTGSMTLGFSIAFLVVSFAMNNHYIKPFSEGAIVVAFSILIVPILDVARVMYLRWREGESIFKPDRNHLHHFFLDAGLSHRATMVCMIILVIFFCLFNIAVSGLMSNNLIVLLNLVSWCLFIRGCGVLKRKNFFSKVQIFINANWEIKSIAKQQNPNVNPVGTPGK
ncbi:MraY family glycosyltransferase [Sphingobacterium sp. SYP-B4668]|uniref:MraY family glycosyltransferase n=1 Tax=Sphingobacterium sp. SYP-B4668 TaxID=2996035 RepID=UPI0022DE91C0|nr:MraY family glycosyltransferase [Sphingobacterium sp. SYP-B4668]